MIALGCNHCAMTGFEDYPTSAIKCRLGHPAMWDFLEGAPYHELVDHRPTEGNWEWTGRGWKNLDYKPKGKIVIGHGTRDDNAER